MTVNAVRRPRRRAAASPGRDAAHGPAETLAIGEIDQTVFDCPSCSRPLALGAHRCPGCGTRLLIGVPLRKASILTAAGLAAGLIAGAAGGVAITVPRATAATVGGGGGGPASSAATAAGGTSAPSSTAPGPSLEPTPTPPAATDSMPSLARSALGQAITVDERMVAAGDSLRTILAASPFSASDVAQILRTISADAVYGEQLADRVTGWPGSVDVGADLGTLYGSLHDSAATALIASVRNESGYREAARSMVGLLAGIRLIDDRARALAAEHGVVLASPDPAPGSSAAP
jgi:hypothetical protein